jgi:hypothetical protein
MKYFHYTIKGDEFSKYTGEVQSVPPDFIEYQITLSGESLYYKLTEGKITDIIGEAIHEPAAKRRVDDFLSRLNAHLV